MKTIKNSGTYQSKIISLLKPLAFALLQLAICDYTFAAHPLHSVQDLGELRDLKSVSNKGENVYKFSVAYETGVSIFLNGLSAGYRIEIEDKTGQIIATTANRGTHWNTPTDPGTTGGSLVLNMEQGYYFVHVTPIDTKGKVYGNKDRSFTLNLIPDYAPNTVIIAPSNSPDAKKTKFVTDGKHDQQIINYALAWVGSIGGGRVLLRPGTYNIYNNIKVVHNNVTLMGTGWQTVLKLADHANLEGAGLVRSRYINNNNHEFYTNQHFMHLVLDGNKANNPNVVKNIGNYGTYDKSSFEDVRVHDFARYGLQPHESVYEETPVSSTTNAQTSDLTIKDSLIDHNGQDGILLEMTVDSTIKNNIIDANGRHGINLDANSIGNHITYNILTNNQNNGVTIQPGSNPWRFAYNNSICDNDIVSNARNGVYLFRSDSNKLSNNNITKNGWYGVHMRSSSYNTLRGNTLNDNSQSSNGAFAGINMSGVDNVFSTQNKILNNFLHTATPTGYKFGIVENDIMDDYNEVIGNVLTFINKPIRLKGAHSVSKDNEV